MNNLANILKEEGQVDHAKLLLLKCIQVDPKFSSAWTNLAIIEMQLSNYNLSKHYLFKAIQLKPSNANSYFNLGNLVIL